ncbi:MAG: hypothetical protein GY851_35645 [bacterium]|nr:hypothetical protein [bacterium]
MRTIKTMSEEQYCTFLCSLLRQAMFDHSYTLGKMCEHVNNADALKPGDLIFCLMCDPFPFMVCQVAEVFGAYKEHELTARPLVVTDEDSRETFRLGNMDYVRLRPDNRTLALMEFEGQEPREDMVI